MSDIERAKELLSTGISCAAVKGAKEYLSEGRGVAPLLDFIDSGMDFSFFSAADKIVGRAAALLFAKLGIKELYAEVLSENAEEILKKNGIEYSFGVKTKNIINRKGDDICPMEKATDGIENPDEAILKIRNTLKLLRGE